MIKTGLKSMLPTLAAMLMMIIVVGCGGGKRQPQEYNKYVEAATSGAISRAGTIAVVLTEDIPEAKREKVMAEKAFTIEPGVEGQWNYIDARTISFRPKRELARNTRYTISMDLTYWFDIEDKSEREYIFEVTTMPLAFEADVASTDIDESDDNYYDVTFDVYTTDSEDASTVEKDIVGTEDCEKAWTHGGDGKCHRVIYRIESQTAERDFALKTKADAANELEERELCTVKIPSKQDFKVIGGRMENGDTKYIEVTFSKLLDKSQDMHGLAKIEDNANQKTDVDKNKMRLYVDAEKRGMATVRLSSAIRSKSGMTLGNDTTIEVEIEETKPQVEFVGNGVIVPTGDQATVTFRAIYLNAVRATIYRIYSNNITSFLQNNELSGSAGLAYVGRPIAVKSIFLKEGARDVRRWGVYSLDLSDLVKVEPGAIYRVELTARIDMSAWPGEEIPEFDRESIEAQDKEIMESRRLAFDSEYVGYYDCGYGEGWRVSEDEEWGDRTDPGKKSYYLNIGDGRNVLSTDFGLTAMSSTTEGGAALTVIALGIDDAKPKEGVDITAYNKQGQETGRATTDSKGEATIGYGSGNGAPYYLKATKGDDVSYLKVTEGQSLSTSTFDVSGQHVNKGLKGYIYGERGVWRPGDTLHIGFMLNDRGGTLPDGHPVELRVTNALGQLVNSQTTTHGSRGLYAFSVPTVADAPTGRWRATINVGGETFEKTLRVETIKPNRLKIDVGVPDMISGKERITLHTEWLSGAKARDMRYEMTAMTVAGTTTWKKWAGYEFDDPTSEYRSEEFKLSEGRTDDSGDATALMEIGSRTTAPGMLRCAVTTRVYEPSGEFSIDKVLTTMSPYTRYVGIKSPQKDKNALATGADHTFALVSVDEKGAPEGGVGLDVNVYKVSWYWWWSSSDGEMAEYSNDSWHSPVKKLSCTTGPDGKAALKLRFEDDEWGTYIIKVRDRQGGHTTGLKAYFDWPYLTGGRSTDKSDGATILSITTDKKTYEVGEEIKISFPSAAGSHAVVAMANGSRVVTSEHVETTAEQTTVSIRATEDMTPNAYVMVTHVQPYKKIANDMPIRMYGIVPVEVTWSQSHLEPQVKAAEEVRPEKTCKITVSEKTGREMSYTLAVVDEGLLNLTRFETPDAWGEFNAREALGVRMWDVYNYVAGAYGGRIEQMYSIGGDGALLQGQQTAVNRFTPVVYFDGPFTLGRGKTAEHDVYIPNYSGQVRVMVVATDGRAYGNAEQSVKVTRPLMLLGTMPRQIGSGDESTVSATVFAMGANAHGNVKVEVTCDDGLEIVGEKSHTISFTGEGDKTVRFRIRAPKGTSKRSGKVRFSASGLNDKTDYTAELPIRTVSQTISKTSIVTVDPGKSYETLMTGVGVKDNEVSIEVSDVAPMSLAGRLKYLIGYPHGCIEQTTSKGFPQLYLPKLAQLSEEQQARVESNVKATIKRLRSFVTSNGGMAYWPGSTYPSLWGSAYAMMFLTEAEGKGYQVPKDLKTGLKSYLTREVKDWKSTSKNKTREVSLALLALANANAAEMGSMNRMKENVEKLGDEDIYNLASAYSLAGRKSNAQQILSKCRGSEAPVRLWALTTVGDANMNAEAMALSKRLSSDEWMSTFETSLSIISMSKYYDKHSAGTGMQFKLTVAKGETEVNTGKMMWTGDYAISGSGSKINLKNTGETSLNVTMTNRGVAEQSNVSATRNGLEVGVTYVDMKGEALSINDVGQGATFKALVTVKNVSGHQLEHVAISHILPSGWEVLDVAENSQLSYVDVRDDRVLSYIDNMMNNQMVTVTVSLSATHAGEFYLPAITAEPMYDNTSFGCTASGEVTSE